MCQQHYSEPLQVNNLGPEDQTSTSPQSIGISRKIVHGIMECRRSAFGGMEKWNIEYCGSKADVSLVLFSGPYRPYKGRSHSAKPSIPTFQYSITCQSPCADFTQMANSTQQLRRFHDG